MEKIKNILSRDKSGSSPTSSSPSTGHNAGGLTGEGSHFANQGGSFTTVDPPDSAVQMSSQSTSGTATDNLLLQPTMSNREASVASVKSGVVGESPTKIVADQPASGHNPLAYKTAEGTPQHGNFDFEQDRQPPEHGNAGSGVGDLGVGAGASTIAADKAFRSHQGTEATGTGGTTSGTIGGREFPLSGGTTTAGQTTDDRAEPGVASTTGGLASGTETPPADGRAGLAGAAGDALSHEHRGHGHEYSGDPCPPGEPPSEGTPHFTTGPHSTDTANRLDPNVQSDVAAQPGTTYVPQNRRASLGDLKLMIRSTNPSSSEAPQPSSQHHYGRDAGVAGAGATAAGVGAYELSKGGNQDTGPASNTIGPHESNIANIVDPRVKPEPEKMKNVGPRPDTGPASATIGPHSSNIANVVDPRVQPDPAKMKDRETVGPHQSDTLNRVDPRVDSSRKEAGNDPAAGATGPTGGAATSGLQGGDPNISSPYNVKPIDPRIDAPGGTHQDQHHYGRDAAVAGGAGAAGAGAYGAYEASKPKDGPISSSQPSTTGYGSQPGTTAQTTQSNLHEDSSQPITTTETAQHIPGGYPTEPSTVTQPSSTNQPSQPISSTQPGQDQDKHHYGRDAALAGGVGAVGGGAYEASKDRNEPVSSSQPSFTGHGLQSSGIAQPGSATHDSGRTDLSHGAVTEGPARVTEQPSSAYDGPHEQQHHHGRDAALAGGAGAAGLGTYEAPKNLDDSSRNVPGTTPGYNDQRAVAPGTATAGQAKEEQPDEHHYGRDAAIAGGTGAIGAGAAYEYQQHEAEKEAKEAQNQAEKEAKQHQKELEKQRAAAEKEHRKQEKAAEKEAKKEQKEHEKEIKKEEKQHEKELKKEEKEHQKELTAAEKEKEKERKRREKELAVAGGAGAAGTAGVAAYEHERHDASGVTPASHATDSAGQNVQPYDPSKPVGYGQDDKRDYRRDAALVGGAGAAGVGAYEVGKRHEDSDRTPLSPGSPMNEPFSHYTQPVGTPAHTVDSVSESSGELLKGTRSHSGRDAAVAGAGAGAAGLAAEEHDRSKEPSPPIEEADDKTKKPSLIQKILHPHKSKEAQTAAEAEAAENERIIRGKADDYNHGRVSTEGDSRVTTDEKGHHKLHKDPPANHPAAQGNQPTGVVTEPHTGLPMNVGKYGSGAGGTDGDTQAIPGYTGSEVGAAAAKDGVVE
ncbi:MAG: hypothetical protein M1820_005066 [Bogoriella megaspora]|nr:MAG: hypothetical protein M1820_005066 [Bogoriella megaspora]